MSSPSFVREQSPELLLRPRDVKVTLPSGRNPKLPSIYVTPHHPLHLGAGMAYFFIHDGTFEGAQAIYNLEVNELRIPQGSCDEAIQMGEHLLKCPDNNDLKCTHIYRFFGTYAWRYYL